MESIEHNQHRNEYLLFIITALNMQMQHFMVALTHHDNCYERLVYRWTIRLYEKGSAKEEALKIITKGRNILMIQRDRLQNELVSSDLLIELLKLLNFRINYNLLTSDERENVFDKIKQLSGAKQAEKVIQEAMEQNHKNHYNHNFEDKEPDDTSDKDLEKSAQRFLKKFKKYLSDRGKKNK